MDGTEVAIKIIYPWLRKDLSSDFAVFRMMGDQIQPGGEHLWDVLFMGDQIQPGGEHLWDVLFMGDQIQPGGEHLWDVLFMGDQIQPGPSTLNPKPKLNSKCITFHIKNRRDISLL